MVEPCNYHKVRGQIEYSSDHSSSLCRHGTFDLASVSGVLAVTMENRSLAPSPRHPRNADWSLMTKRSVVIEDNSKNSTGQIPWPDDRSWRASGGLNLLCPGPTPRCCHGRAGGLNTRCSFRIGLSVSCPVVVVPHAFIEYPLQSPSFKSCFRHDTGRIVGSPHLGFAFKVSQCRLLLTDASFFTIYKSSPPPDQVE